MAAASEGKHVRGRGRGRRHVTLTGLQQVIVVLLLSHSELHLCTTALATTARFDVTVNNNNNNNHNHNNKLLLDVAPTTVDSDDDVKMRDDVDRVTSSNYRQRETTNERRAARIIVKEPPIDTHVIGGTLNDEGADEEFEEQPHNHVLVEPINPSSSISANNNLISTNNSNTNATANETTQTIVPSFPMYMRIIATCACAIILTIGVTGNLLVPLVVVKTNDLHNSTNLFLINLSIADLLVLLVCMPTVLVELHSLPETWLLGEPMCKLTNFVEQLAANGSILTILAISFERYYAICKPLKAGYKCTKVRALIIICLVWLLALLLTSPVLGMAKSYETRYIDGSLVRNCILDTNDYWPKMYVFVSMIAFFWLPLLVLVGVYSLIAKRLVAETTTRQKCSSKLMVANHAQHTDCQHNMNNNKYYNYCHTNKSSQRHSLTSTILSAIRRRLSHQSSPINIGNNVNNTNCADIVINEELRRRAQTDSSSLSSLSDSYTIVDKNNKISSCSSNNNNNNSATGYGKSNQCQTRTAMTGCRLAIDSDCCKGDTSLLNRQLLLTWTLKARGMHAHPLLTKQVRPLIESTTNTGDSSIMHRFSTLSENSMEHNHMESQGSPDQFAPILVVPHSDDRPISSATLVTTTMTTTNQSKQPVRSLSLQSNATSWLSSRPHTANRAWLRSLVLSPLNANANDNNNNNNNNNLASTDTRNVPTTKPTALVARLLKLNNSNHIRNKNQLVITNAQKEHTPTSKLSLSPQPISPSNISSFHDVALYNSSQQMKSRRQVVVMLTFVVTCFFLLFFPYRVFTIWLIFSTEDQIQAMGMETYYNLSYFSRILIHLHSAINPIVYNLISTKFRRAFIRILTCRDSNVRRKFTTEYRGTTITNTTVSVPNSISSSHHHTKSAAAASHASSWHAHTTTANAHNVSNVDSNCNNNNNHNHNHNNNTNNCHNDCNGKVTGHKSSVDRNLTLSLSSSSSSDTSET